MYQVWVAYLLWFVGGFGFLGLHRFYLRKIPTGVLWILTGGGFLVGTVYDFLTLSKQVDVANQKSGLLPVGGNPVRVQVSREKEPLERVILRLAQSNGGRVSPIQVAAESDWTVDEAQAHLDSMAKKGLCDLRVLKSGATTYHFPEFDPSASQEFDV